jgi:predicted amidohydrolase
MIVAIGQLRITPDRDVNLMKALSLVKRAIQVRADVIVLPEVMNTGFFPENYALAGSAEEELDLILKLSERRDIVIVAGIAEREAGHLYNSVAVVYRGEIIDKYRKILPFVLTDEVRHFKPGNELKVVETPSGKIGLMVCYEIRFPEIARKLVKMGADFLAVPAEFPKERIEHWRLLLRARALENLCYVVGANCVEGDLGYPGHSMIVDPLGDVVVEAGGLQEVIMGEISLEEQDRIRKRLPFLDDMKKLNGIL